MLTAMLLPLAVTTCKGIIMREMRVNFKRNTCEVINISWRQAEGHADPIEKNPQQVYHAQPPHARPLQLTNTVPDPCS